MKLAVLTLPALVILSGCGLFVSSEDTEYGAEPTTPAHCLTISDGAQTTLQRHLQGGTIIRDVAAVLSPVTGDGWFVAATLDVQGDEVTAIWYTVNDPTAEGDNAYMSVDAMAATISDFMRPTNATGTEDGADLARGCLQ